VFAILFINFHDYLPLNSRTSMLGQMNLHRWPYHCKKWRAGCQAGLWWSSPDRCYRDASSCTGTRGRM